MGEARQTVYPKPPPMFGPGDNYGWNAPPEEIGSGELWELETGRSVGERSYFEGQRAKALLREQSDEIVERLGRVGIKGSSGRQLTAVGLVSGAAEEQPDYRNCNIIPACQSRNVNDMMMHVRFYMDRVPRKQLRMLVISGGWVPLDRLREHHQAHVRRISRLAARRELKEAGIEVAYFNVENTIHRTDDGVPMLNLHSHLIIRCRRFLGRRKWAAMMELFKTATPKGYVHDSPIQKPAEVVKYVFKPVEFRKLTDAELGELFLQVTGGREKRDPDTGELVMRKMAPEPVSDDPDELTLWREGEELPVIERPLKFFHPLGEMRRFRAELRRRGEKLIMLPTEDGRWVWRRKVKAKPEPQAEDTRSKAQGNIVVAVTAPQARFSDRKEPCVIVEGFGGDFDQMVRVNGLQDLVARARSLHADRRRAEKMAADAALRAAEGQSREEAPSMQHTNNDNCPGGPALDGRRRWHPPPPEAPPDRPEALH